MTTYHYYVLLGSMVSTYTLGLMHAKNHRHWKNVLMALATGVLWPLAMLYGIYLYHFDRTDSA